jgi:hypothetical protein
MLWHYCKQTSYHISTRVLQHIRDTRLQNQESLIGEHSTKTKSDKITLHIMGSISSGKPLKYSSTFNHEVGYGGAEGILANIFSSNFLLNHSACYQCIAPYSTFPTLLALQDLYVGLQPPNLLFLQVITVLYNETHKNMT